MTKTARFFTDNKGMGNTKGKKNKKKSNNLLLIFWLLILILLIVVFFVKKDQIKKNLDDTDFFSRVFGKTPEFVLDRDKSSAPAKENLDLLGAKKPEETYTEITGTEANKVSAEVLEDSKKEIQKNENQVLEKAEKAESPAQKEPAKAEEKSPAEEKKPLPLPKKTEITLYFVSIDSDGSVSRKAVKRSLDKSDSPLTDSINHLLAGPSFDESSKDYMTLIPEGSRLLGASVKNGTATLNFNENFEFNRVGVEGYIAQLMQVVYTATEFPTVRNVQFLIEGEKKDYLGSEGQWIGSPLARSSF